MAETVAVEKSAVGFNFIRDFFSVGGQDKQIIWIIQKSDVNCELALFHICPGLPTICGCMLV